MNSSDTCTIVGAFFLIALAVALVLGMPLAQIWALNTLFKLNIEYSLINWFAVVVLNFLWCRFPTVSKK